MPSKKRGNPLHVFLHELLSTKVNGTNVLDRKYCVLCFGRHLKIDTKLRKSILKEMIEEGFLERVTRDKVKVVNPIFKESGLEKSL